RSGMMGKLADRTQQRRGLVKTSIIRTAGRAESERSTDRHAVCAWTREKTVFPRYRHTVTAIGKRSILIGSKRYDDANFNILVFRWKQSCQQAWSGTEGGRRIGKFAFLSLVRGNCTSTIRNWIS